MRDREKTRKRRELEDRAVFAVKVGLLAFVIYAFVSMSLAPVESTCTGCHRSVAQSHETVAHAAVSCNSCHSGTTITERLNFRVSYARMIPATALGRQPETTLVSNDNCTVCHAEQVLSPFVADTGIRMSHREKMARGYKCSDCHSDTGHALIGDTIRRVDMFDCFTCHSTLESARCEICHAGERTTERRPYQSVWRLTHGENWRELHGMGGLQTCNVCHHPSYCTRCHGIEMPHPAGFHYRHGAEAVAVEDEGVCYTCHDSERFCYACHQMEMPHPDGFLQAHSSTPDEDEETCYRCHSPSSCLRCHTAHTHPGIPTDSLRQLRGRLGLD